MRRGAETVPATAPQVGFFGKVPTRGDFVNRRISHGLHGALDQWLSRAIVTSQRQLGDDWLPTYLVAPVWRFVTGAGTIGQHPTIGVLMPSVDRVGRYFPLILAAELPGCASPSRLFRVADDWFDGAEALARSCLADDFEFDRFDASVRDFALPALPPAEANLSGPRRFALDGEGDPLLAYTGAVEGVLAGTHHAFSMWWTHGSPAVAPSLLLHKGAPAPEQFAALLDGRWRAWGWHEGASAATFKPNGKGPEAPVPDAEPAQGVIKLLSAARSHKGARRTRNEDAVVARPDLGLWAVVDGAGGHAAAAFAAETVATKLEELKAPVSNKPMRDEVDSLLREANDALRARARRLGPDQIVAAVVVALMIHGGRYAVVWAGDSRAYLARDRALTPLTQDHVERDGRKYVTRAVGAEDAFEPEWAHGAVKPGDRFILCSDGLVGALGELGLGHAVGHGGPDEAVGTAIDDALIAGARDNISAVVIDVAGDA